jgi:ribosomal peptide maturation radical SAM protein 1
MPMQIDLTGIARTGDALLVVPPFASIDRPSFGLHLLKALAEREHFRVEVLYANILFARDIGERLYTDICYSDTGELNGEKVFAPAAFGKNYPKLANRSHAPRLKSSRAQMYEIATRHGLSALDEVAVEWTDALVRALAELDYPVVGFNIMFEQTTATVAISRRLKEARPEIRILAGGSLCEGPMAHGLRSLTSSIDHVFSGESETTFVKFLHDHRRHVPAQPVIEGQPCFDLEALPPVNYDGYFAQLDQVLPDSKIRTNNLIWLPYEGSRGCWWGQKHHCTFCGINGTGMAYRQKSASKVYRELAELKRHHPARQVLMLDNIMPYRYFKDLMPMLKAHPLDLDIFYEQKANLTFRRMRSLSDAGVNLIQPGIEALADGMLKLMKKGVRARQNIAALRFARSVEVSVNWNVLYGFPGDDDGDYRATIDLIPLLTHLHPPTGLCHLSIDRFSPYHNTPAAYGIRSIWPMHSYFDVFPDHTDFNSLAYHFEGDYDTAARRDLASVSAMNDAIEKWRGLWEDTSAAPPTLAVQALEPNTFLIVDTRACRGQQFHLVDRSRAMAALVESSPDSVAARWAIANQLAVRIDDVVVPLAVASRELFASIFDDIADRRQHVLAA